MCASGVCACVLSVHASPLLIVHSAFAACAVMIVFGQKMIAHTVGFFGICQVQLQDTVLDMRAAKEVRFRSDVCLCMTSCARVCHVI